MKAKEILKQMSVKEKLMLTSGKDFWHLIDFEKYGIPTIMVTDGPHGLRKKVGKGMGIGDAVPSTAFPTASCSASSWDKNLLNKMGKAMGEECIAEEVSVILGPGVNMKRSPLCGRNFEYFSEDPVLAGEMGAALINGVQETGVGTSLKHFAANNQETFRMTGSSNVDERTLREYYLQPFEIAVKKSQPFTVMTAYNKVNNVQFQEHAYSYQMQNGKKHEIKAQILEMSLLNKVFSAEGNTISSITEKGRPVVIVTADKQEYNKNNNVMKATGNVNIVYKDVETLSNQAIVDLTKDNDVKRIQLIGNAKLNQSGNKISANKLDYNNISQEAIATGSVYSDIITEDNKNIKVWSDYQSYNRKANFITASGSTTIKYEDYTAKGPKVNVFSDKKTNKLNEAVFIGRSKIETKGRTIEADRISITMNPKDFKAEGNVKSVIPNVGN